MHDQASAARSMTQGDPDDWNTKAETNLLPPYAALNRGDFAAATPPFASLLDRLAG